MARQVARGSVETNESPTAVRQDGKPTRQTTKLAFIDALRGYAVLLVITSHTGGVFPELPYPLKKLTNFGWNGVQLFFLMSCVTLLMSWRSDEARGQTDLPAFWIRRLFRIAPMYYLAALLYFLIEPPPGGFDPPQLLATLGFVNVWHPDLVPTVPDRWLVVPGGWSIGVEVTFYLLFPFIATLVRSMLAAMAFCAIALAIGCAANPIMDAALRGTYGDAAIRNFLYFWFPNQMPVFALGTVLYFILLRLKSMPADAVGPMLLRRHGTLVVLACFVVGVTAANLPFPQSLPFTPPLFVPTLLIASLIFMAVAAVLATDPGSPFINLPICSFGRVSFSAYLWHFAVLRELPMLLPGVFDVDVAGWRAIFTWCALWLSAVAITYALSAVTFQTVENPMIELGRRLIAARRRRMPTKPRDAAIRG